MQIFPIPTEFEWDRGNFDKNKTKHGIQNQEVEEVFFNIPLLLIDDESHSKNEGRYLVLGKTDSNKKLSIIFTIRKNRVRVISARPMSKKERQLYEKR
jgi:hypothetical protein